MAARFTFKGVSMNHVLIDDGRVENPASRVDLAAAAICQQGRGGSSPIVNPDVAGVFHVPAATSVSTGEGFRPVNGTATIDVLHGVDGGRSSILNPDVDGLSVPPASDSTDPVRDMSASGVGRSEMDEYPVPGRTTERNRRIAGHEIGHAWVMRVLSDAPISFVTIARRDGFEGRACGADYEESHRNLEDQTGTILDGCARIEKMTPGLGSNRIESAELYVRAQTMVIELVAGSVAERILFPDETPLRAEHDKIEARAVAAIACASPRSVDALLAWAECEAENLIRENLGAVLALVDALVDSADGRLTGEQVDSVIQSAMDREYHMNVEVERRTEWSKVLTNAAEFTARETQSEG
jgi:hypothetical protein